MLPYTTLYTSVTSRINHIKEPPFPSISIYQLNMVALPPCEGSGYETDFSLMQSKYGIQWAFCTSVKLSKSKVTFLQITKFSWEMVKGGGGGGGGAWPWTP